MSRPTEEIIEEIDASEVGAHGCLLPTGDAVPEEGEDDEE